MIYEQCNNYCYSKVQTSLAVVRKCQRGLYTFGANYPPAAKFVLHLLLSGEYTKYEVVLILWILCFLQNKKNQIDADIATIGQIG